MAKKKHQPPQPPDQRCKYCKYEHPGTPWCDQAYLHLHIDELLQENRELRTENDMLLRRLASLELDDQKYEPQPNTEENA